MTHSPAAHRSCQQHGQGERRVSRDAGSTEAVDGQAAQTPDAAYGADYAEWKDWRPEQFGQVPRYQRYYYPAELRRCTPPLPAQARVLELGFGNGAFLSWGRGQGWEMHGTEANPHLVQAARAQGYQADVVDGNSSGLAAYPGGHFDLVVAFDVLEHVPQERLPGLLTEVRRVLRPGAAFVARFPNADSPFGLAKQHGDVTHVTAIGQGKVRYLARRLGAQVHFVGGEAQPLWAGRSLTSVQHLASAPVKALARLLTRAVWLPHSTIDFWSINLVMSLRWPQRGQGGGA